MYPFDDPFVVNELFGIITIRWYAVAILGGAILAAWFGARRAVLRGYNPDHVWNLLAIGLVTSIAVARAWYVFFEWPNFRDKSLLYIINPQTGGIAIQGALVGALIGGFIYTRWNKLRFLDWIDVAAPCLPIGQAIGRWGNFMNQEAYGRPMTTPLPWGLRIDADRRVAAFPADRFPVDTTRFHPTFLYESLWNVIVLIALLALERRLRRWLRPGDLFLFYGILYSIGRFFVEGLRTDSLCTNGIGGSCAGALRTAQVTALVTIVLFGAILAFRHARHRRSAPAQPVTS